VEKATKGLGRNKASTKNERITMANQDHNRDSLIAHIHAQDTIIRDRNNKIAELNAKLNKIQDDPIPVSVVMQKKIDAAYKKGWKAAYKSISSKVIKNMRDLDYLSEPPIEG
jgi:hypothetical protein